MPIRCRRNDNLHGNVRDSSPVALILLDVINDLDFPQNTFLLKQNLLLPKVLTKLGEPVRQSAPLDAPLPDVIRAVKAHGPEGIVAKRLDSRYEPGQRSGAWQQMRVSQGQEFVIGGYTPSSKNFDALTFATMKAATFFTPPEPAVASRQPAGYNSIGASRAWESLNVRSRTCPSGGRAAGDRDSPPRRSRTAAGWSLYWWGSLSS